MTAFEPGVRITLARAGKVELREASKRLFVVLTAALLIVVLLGGSRNSPGFQWVLAPIIALLVVVIAFGLLALARSARRAAAGVHLAVDTGAGLISGFAVGQTLAALRIAKVSELKRLVLEVRRSAGPDRKDPRSWATLELQLEDGTRLEAPDAWGPDDQADATEELLVPLGRALSRLCGRPLEVTRLWSGETRVEKP